MVLIGQVKFLITFFKNYVKLFFSCKRFNHAIRFFRASEIVILFAHSFSKTNSFCDFMAKISSRMFSLMLKKSLRIQYRFLGILIISILLSDHYLFRRNFISLYYFNQNSRHIYLTDINFCFEFF